MDLNDTAITAETITMSAAGKSMRTKTGGDAILNEASPSVAMRDPAEPATVTQADLNGCVVLVNGRTARKGTKLAEGDTVHLMSPVCGC